MAKIQLIIVTPEKTTFEQEVDSVVLPLIDGEAGILPGHAPMLGRLGPGELRAKHDSTTSRFYLDGGFVQVEEHVVTVLPGKSIPASEINLADAQAELVEAQSQGSTNPELAEMKTRAILQARAKIRIAQQA